METSAQDELKAHLMATDEQFRNYVISIMITTQGRGAGSKARPYGS